jgi:MarR-like DNA-binding transcriptional regulator SgrR of sgrS sRNA
MLSSGDLDIAEIRFQEYSHFLENRKWQDSFRVFSFQKFGYLYLTFNMKKRQITRNLRQAFYRELIASGKIAEFMGARGEACYSPFIYLQRERFSPDVVPFSGKVSLTLLTTSENPLRRDLATIIAQLMKNCGINLRCEFRDYQTFLQNLKTGDFEIAMSAFILDADWNLRDLLASGAVCNYASFSSPAIDSLLEDGLKEADPARREQIYRRINSHWQKELPFFPLFTIRSFFAVRKEIRVIAPYRTVCSGSDFLFNINTWERNTSASSSPHSSSK